MKKSVLLFCAMAALAVSCQKEPKGPVYPVPEPNTTYKFEGTVATEGFTWKTNSAIGVYSAMEDVKIINKPAYIEGYVENIAPVIDEETGENINKYTPSPYDGKNIGVFNSQPMDLVQGENKFMIYSPYSKDLVYNKGIIYGLSIDDAQKQVAPNVAADCFAMAYCTAIPGVDETFKFELNPVTALAQVSITTTELTGYSPTRVSIYDDNNTPMAGGFNLNPETLEIIQTGEPLNRVSVTVDQPVALTSGAVQNIYLNILPVDFTGKELWVIVELQNQDGSSLTIPTKQKDLKFVAGQTTKIDLSGLNTSMNGAGDWYVASETRYLAGNGVAYGDANTYFIQCKNGTTYTGATYTPNPDIPDEVKIDIRARGNFYNAVDPRGATFEWVTNAAGVVYTCRTAGYDSVISPDGYEFSYDGNYTVTVKNVSALAGSPILLMKKDGKTLWAWTFWNIAADGTKVEAYDLCGYKVAPMEIGISSTQYDTWTANKKGTNPDVIYRTANYYQWGRPMPVFWTSYWTLTGGHDGSNPVTSEQCMAILSDPLTIAQSLENPVGLILNPVDATDQANWCSEPNNKFWGSTSGDLEKEGIKSIYDPCPKGWRVPDAIWATRIGEEYPDANSIEYVDNAGYPGVKIGGVQFVCCGYGNGKTSTNGRLATMGGGENGSASASSHGLFWTNVSGNTQGNALYVRSSASKAAPRRATYNKSVSAPVRCVVDTDNR